MTNENRLATQCSLEYLVKLSDSLAVPPLVKHVLIQYVMLDLVRSVVLEEHVDSDALQFDVQ